MEEEILRDEEFKIIEDRKRNGPIKFIIKDGNIRKKSAGHRKVPDLQVAIRMLEHDS